MLQTILQKLTGIGLSENEAKAYTTLLKKGSSTASHLSKNAKMDRSSCYRAIENLHKRGFVSAEPNKSRTVYTALPPSHILIYVQDKHNKVSQDLKVAKQVIKEIKSEINLSEMTSKIQVLEGKNVIKDIWEDMLSDEVKIQRQLIRKDVQEFLIDYYEGWVENYIKRRTKKGIKLRYLTNEKWFGGKYTSSDKKGQKEVRKLPKKFNFSTNLVIYGDKMATHTLDQNNLKGIIISDKDVVDTQRALFDLAWSNSTKL